MKTKEHLVEYYQIPGIKVIEIKSRRVLCGSSFDNVANPFGGDGYGEEQEL